MRNNIRILLIYCVFLILVIPNTGCFTYRVMDSPIGADVVPYSTTEWSFFWGLQQAKEKKGVCDEKGVAKFKVKNNLGFSIISVVTLGIANPMQIEWECAPEGDDHGTIGTN